MSKKNLLVVYEKPWMARELNSAPNVKKHVTCTMQQRKMSDAKIVQAKTGTKVEENWLLQNIISKEVREQYDGVAIVLEGERLGGRHGNHTKKVYNGKRFSIIQMEAKKNRYRTWIVNDKGKWELQLTRSRRNSSYTQTRYTFEHEVGHMVSYHTGMLDTLHAFIERKMYEEWWLMMWILKS